MPGVGIGACRSGGAGSGSSSFLTEVTPSAGGAGIQAAINEVATAGGGIVQLEAGTYTVTDMIEWPSDASNVVLQGVGPATVLDSQLPLVGGLPEYCISIRAEENPSQKNIVAPTKNATQVTCSTVAEGALFLEDYWCIIRGTNAAGEVWEELNQVAADGSGVTGVVTLRSHIVRSYSSGCTLRAFGAGVNNGVRDLKIIHTAVGTHAIRVESQKGAFIENCRFDGSVGSQNRCLQLTGVHNSWFSNNLIENYTFIEGGTTCWAVDFYGIDSTFESNKIHNCGNSGATGRGGVNIRNVYNCKFVNNTITGCDGPGVFATTADHQRNILIQGNHIIGCRDNGIHLGDATTTSDIDILGNFIEGAGLVTGLNGGIYLRAVRANIIGNVCNKCDEAGISVQFSERINITGNVCSNNTLGITVLTDSTNINISGNSVANNSYAGIYLSDVTYVQVTGNVSVSNVRGMACVGTCTNVRFSGNTMRSNTTAAIDISNASSNCTVNNNEYGGNAVNFGSGTGHSYDNVRTYTPTVTLVGGAGNTVPVYTTNTGQWIRNGDQVEVEVYLDGDGGAEGAGTGVLNIALPQAASANHPTAKFWAGYGLNNAAEYQLLGQIAGSATTISLSYFNLISTTTAFTGADQNNATRTIRLKFRYSV